MNTRSTSIAIAALMAMASECSPTASNHLFRIDAMEENYQPGMCRSTGVDVGTAGNRCRWRKRKDQKRADRRKRLKEHKERFYFSNPDSRLRRFGRSTKKSWL